MSRPLSSSGRAPNDFAALAARASFSSHQPGAKGDRELLPYFTVVIRHHVTRIRVRPGDGLDFDVIAGLFPDFAYDRVHDRLPDLMTPARKGPQVVVSFVNQKDAPLIVTHDSYDRGYDAVRFRRCRIVDVIDPSHGATIPRLVEWLAARWRVAARLFISHVSMSL